MSKKLAKSLHELLTSVDLATMSHRNKDERGIEVHLENLNKKYQNKRNDLQQILNLLQEEEHE